MRTSIKRFLIPAILLISLIIFFMIVPDGYSDLWGGISTFFVLIILPLFLISLVWSVLNAIRDYKKIRAGLSVETEVFPVVKEIKDKIISDRKEVEELSEDQKKLRFKYRFIGTIIILIGIPFFVMEHYYIFTFFLIGGCTLFIMSSPKMYNGAVDGIKMISCPKEYTLDRIYEDFKEYNTVYGSVYRGTTFPNNPALFWKGMEDDWLFYLYKPKGKDFVYVGSGMDIGCKQLSQPLISPKPNDRKDFEGILCYNMENINFVWDMSDVLTEYFKTGNIPSLPDYKKGNIYYFEEYFKLTGQRFTVYNASKQATYYVEGTMPLKSFHIYDTDENEIYKVSKEIVHALPHYLFYDHGKLVGEFIKKVDLARDAFTMQMKDGLLEMKEVNTYIGSNYVITLDGKRIGMIAEKLNLSIENIIFNNMVLTVYEDQYTSLITALAIMAVRELERDRQRDN